MSCSASEVNMKKISVSGKISESTLRVWIKLNKDFTSTLSCALFVFLCNLCAVSSFNIDIPTAVIQRGPGGTHFGFSVSQHKDRGTSW